MPLGTVAGVTYANLPTVFTIDRWPSHSSLVTGLVNGGSYAYYVRCQDGAGNANTNDFAIAFSVATPPPTDTQPPTVALTAPTSGAVTGSVTVAATASDNVSVVGVQFLLNGANLGVEDLAVALLVDLEFRDRGQRHLSAGRPRRDAAGNVTTSSAVTVTVNNTAPTGLVASYSFNEGTGTTLADRSGNGRTGTVSGATWTSQGRFGGALSFDGVNDWVTVADANALGSDDRNDAGSVGLSNGERQRVVAQRHHQGAAERRGLQPVREHRRERPDRVRGTGRAAGRPLDARGTAAVPLNTWTHLAATYDGTTLRLFVNGTQVGSRAVSGALLTSSGVLRIGGNSLWGEYFAGRIDEVRIYNRALTQSEIAADAAAPVQP